MSNLIGNRFTRTDIWREGAWLDLWSVVHLLSGASIGAALYLLHVNVLVSAGVTLLLLFLYELFEIIVQIKETPANRLLDIVMGITGYLMVFLLFYYAHPYGFTMAAGGFLITVTTVMSIFGWRASQKATALKKVHLLM